jgi:DNA-directed RNA polymerase specialized sigma24 family protein
MQHHTPGNERGELFESAAIENLGLLYQTAFWTLLDRAQAERLVGDTYTEATLRFRPTGEYRRTIRLLLFRILVRKLLGRVPAPESGLPDGGDDLTAPLAALSSWHRLLLVLSNVAALGYPEIARVTDRRVEQVRADMARARLELQQRLRALPLDDPGYRSGLAPRRPDRNTPFGFA